MTRRRRRYGSTVVDREYLGDLPAFLALRHQHAQLGSGRHGVQPERLHRLDVQKRVTGAIGHFGEAEAFLRIEPLHDRFDRGAVRDQRLATRRTRLMKIERRDRIDGLLFERTTALAAATKIPTSPHYDVSPFNGGATAPRDRLQFAWKTIGAPQRQQDYRRADKSSRPKFAFASDRVRAPQPAGAGVR